MNVGAIVKAALFGAVLGGTWGGWRSYGAKKGKREPLPTVHENLELIDEDLVQALQELRDMALMPKENHGAFSRLFIGGVNALERIAAIEVQIERQEIVAGFRDSTEASQLAESAMRHLREIEKLFESSEIRVAYRDKLTEIQKQIGSHLQNINSQALNY